MINNSRGKADAYYIENYAIFMNTIYQISIAYLTVYKLATGADPRSCFRTFIHLQPLWRILSESGILENLCY